MTLNPCSDDYEIDRACGRSRVKSERELTVRLWYLLCMKNRRKATLLERAAVVEGSIHRVKGLSEIEKTFCALGLAASPEERWEINRFMVERLPPASRKAMEADAFQSAEAQFKK